ncbi:hypothetical protein MHBO_000426 [Bonamia ostreae]|uniref:Mitochondrial processing peptidase alpha subunit n=1 Tax=Bonamia ostreae TaxID=126728 RepID=A0ABV2AFN1_9EUKA
MLSKFAKKHYIKTNNIRFRTFFTGKSSMPRVELTKEFPIESNLNPEKKLSMDPVVSKLRNGINIASRETLSPMASICLAVKTGYTFEDKHFYGRTHFLAKTAFTSTEETSTFSINQQLERTGAKINTLVDRDGILYNVDVLKKFVPTVLHIMSDSLFNPAFHGHELNNICFNHQNALKEIPSDQQLEDDIHLAAYGLKGPGLPLMAPRAILDKMRKPQLVDFHSKLMRPERISIGAMGVDAAAFKNSAEEFFGGKKSSEKKETEDFKGVETYVGGEVRHNDVDTGKETFITVALKTDGTLSNEIPKICIFSALLGGGQSFSVGGPGKGMTSRLYKEMVVRTPGCSSSASLAHIHSTSGLFGITASCDYDNARAVSKALLKQIRDIAEAKLLTYEEMERARNAAMSQFLTSASNREIMAEDYARQLLYFGKIYGIEEMKKQLKAVTKEDMINAAKRWLSSKPSVAVRGNVLDVPSYRDIEKELQTQFC